MGARLETRHTAGRGVERTRRWVRRPDGGQINSQSIQFSEGGLPSHLIDRGNKSAIIKNSTLHCIYEPRSQQTRSASWSIHLRYRI